MNVPLLPPLYTHACTPTTAPSLPPPPSPTSSTSSAVVSASCTASLNILATPPLPPLQPPSPSLATPPLPPCNPPLPAQVLVSIQSMILVADPYYNEPGWEVREDKAGGEAGRWGCTCVCVCVYVCVCCVCVWLLLCACLNGYMLQREGRSVRAGRGLLLTCSPPASLGPNLIQQPSALPAPRVLGLCFFDFGENHPLPHSSPSPALPCPPSFTITGPGPQPHGSPGGSRLLRQPALQHTRLLHPARPADRSGREECVGRCGAYRGGVGVGDFGKWGQRLWLIGGCCVGQTYGTPSQLVCDVHDLLLRGK